MRIENHSTMSRFLFALASLLGAGIALAGTSSPGAVPPKAQRPIPVSSAEVVGRRTLTLEGARRAMRGALQHAKSLGATGVIAIVDEGGNPIALERIDGTFPAGANISIGKARTAALFKKPTRVFEEIIRAGRSPMIALHDFTPLIGGVPLVSGGEVIGGIGVSGAASAEQDEQLALAGARALESATAEPTGTWSPMRSAPRLEPVTFFGREAVRVAFEKGNPILENSEFKIHASRREAAGLAEVHLEETDIVYVQRGEATLVTGGKLASPQETAPKELRGSAIEGGQSRELLPGDVVVIPKGVPHWFKRVSNPFTYYVVKVIG